MRTPVGRRWSDLAPWWRVGVVLAGLVQTGLSGAALADLCRRDAGKVNGPRWVWALASLLNVIGPITYFAVGRDRDRVVGSGGAGTHGPDGGRRWTTPPRP